MSYATLILGESGTGKTCSLRNLDPNDVLLIQPVRKPLPFRSKGWREFQANTIGDIKNATGSILVCADAKKICVAMRHTTKPIVIVDDWQYILASQFMSRRNEKSYDKFTDIGGSGWDIAQCASEIAHNQRVYVLAHTHTDEQGNIRIKTLGKLLDDKVVVEGMFTTVLRTHVDAGANKYVFTTHNNGRDTVKSPMGMFDTNEIENDLAKVDEAICDYYGIERDKQAQPTQPKPTAKQSEKLGLYENDTHALIHEDAGDRI